MKRRFLDRKANRIVLSFTLSFLGASFLFLLLSLFTARADAETGKIIFLPPLPDLFAITVSLLGASLVVLLVFFILFLTKKEEKRQAIHLPNREMGAEIPAFIKEEARKEGKLILLSFLLDHLPSYWEFFQLYFFKNAYWLIVAGVASLEFWAIFFGALAFQAEGMTLYLILALLVFLLVALLYFLLPLLAWIKHKNGLSKTRINVFDNYFELVGEQEGNQISLTLPFSYIRKAKESKGCFFFCSGMKQSFVLYFPKADLKNDEQIALFRELIYRLK